MYSNFGSFYASGFFIDHPPPILARFIFRASCGTPQDSATTKNWVPKENLTFGPLPKVIYLLNQLAQFNQL